MAITDQDFREEYKPIHIPAHYNPADSEQDKVVFALAQIGEGSAGEVLAELAKYDDKTENAKAVLEYLFNKGLIKAENVKGVTRYNLSKITHANDGAVNPDLLAPGLD